MSSYAFTRSRIFQWMGILLSLGIIAVGYWYYQSQASTLNKSPTGSLTTSLVGYWTFDASSTTSSTATDQGSGGNNGTLTNSPQITEGKNGQGLNFFPNGSDNNSKVDMGDPVDGDLDFGSGDFSVGFWMKGQGFSSQGNSINSALAKRNYNTANAAGYGFSYPSTNLMSFIIADGTSTYTVTQAVATVNDNQWHHYTGVRSGSTMYLYVDGVSVGSTSVSGSVSNGFNFVVGTEGSVNQNDRNANAVIDEVRVYNTAITAAQIQSLYQLGISDKMNTSVSQPQGTGRFDSGLAAYWRFDDGSGTSATDSSTNGSTGTLTNGPAWTTGQVAGALDFDGTNDRMDVTDANNLDITGTLTLSAWIKKDAGPGVGAFDMILIKGNSGAPAVNYALGTYTISGPQERAHFSYYNGGTSHSVYGSTTLSNGTWYHIAAVYNDTANSFQLYVNGTLETLTTISGDVANNSMVTNAYDMFVGHSNGTSFFDGQIDEVRVYSRTFSADEIKQLYSLTSPTGVDTSLKGYWSFNAQDMNGTSAYDRSGVGSTGTLTNGPTVTEGIVGQALSFDGSNDYVAMTSSSALNPTTAITLSAWVKRGTTGTRQIIVSKGDFGFASTTQYWLEFSAANLPIFGFHNSTNAYTVSGPVAITDSNWHLITATYDSTTRRLYIDGVQVNSAALALAINSNSGEFAIGTSATSHGSLYSGSIDEVRIYNAALSAAQIKNLYDQGQSDKTNTSVSQPQGTGRLDSGLAGYWAMDNGSGTSATDSSTNGNTGTLTSGPTWTTGQIGGAVDFDGSNDYIDLGTIGMTNPARFTAAVWIKVDDIAFGVTHTIFSNRTGGNAGMTLSLNSGASCSPRPDCTPLTFTIQGVAAYTGSYNVFEGEWTHIGLTWDGSRATFYINGASVETISTGSMTTGTNMLLGTSGPSPGTSFLNGQMDEMRFYNRVLSVDEVASLYRLTTPTGVDTGLKGYWSFNGQDMNGTTTAYDRSGAGNNGTLTNGPAITEGKSGQALQFDGSNDYVNAGTGVSITGAITLSLWAKTSATGNQTLLGTRTVGNAGYMFTMLGSAGSYKLRFTYFGVFDWDSSASVYSADGNWHHYTVVNNLTDVRFYVDGTLASTVASGTSGASSNVFLALGALNDQYSAGTVAAFFNGSLDEIRAYNTALSASQVAALYNQGR